MENEIEDILCCILYGCSTIQDWRCQCSTLFILSEDFFSLRRKRFFSMFFSPVVNGWLKTNPATECSKSGSLKKNYFLSTPICFQQSRLHIPGENVRSERVSENSSAWNPKQNHSGGLCQSKPPKAAHALPLVKNSRTDGWLQGKETDGAVLWICLGCLRYVQCPTESIIQSSSFAPYIRSPWI